MIGLTIETVAKSDAKDAARRQTTKSGSLELVNKTEKTTRNSGFRWC